MKRSSLMRAPMSDYDPKQTFGRRSCGLAARKRIVHQSSPRSAPINAMHRSRRKGSKTPITHRSSLIQFVISRRIADLHNRRTPSRASPIERPTGSPIVDYSPRCVPNCVCLGGHTTAPHHLSGPPPPAKAVLEMGATVAVPIVSAATANTIASDVFMVGSPFKLCCSRPS